MMIVAAILLCLVTSVFAGNTAPDFSLPDLSQKTVTLSSLLDKGPVVLDFWATWCGPCVRELPRIQELHEEFGDGNVTFVGICDDGPKTLSRVKPFVRGRKLTFTILLDTENEVMRKYKISNLPYTCIVDTSGAIAYGHLGYKPGDEKELREKLLEILGRSEKGETE